MYIFVSSLIRAKGTNQPYKNVDISRVKLSQIYKTYNDGFISLELIKILQWNQHTTWVGIISIQN